MRHHAGNRGVSLIPSMATSLASFPLCAFLIHLSHWKLPNIDRVVWASSILTVVIDDIEIILLQKCLLLLLCSISLGTASRGSWDRSETPSFSIALETTCCSWRTHTTLMLLPCLLGASHFVTSSI